MDEEKLLAQLKSMKNKVTTEFGLQLDLTQQFCSELAFIFFSTPSLTPNRESYSLAQMCPVYHVPQVGFSYLCLAVTGILGVSQQTHLLI